MSRISPLMAEKAALPLLLPNPPPSRPIFPNHHDHKKPTIPTKMVRNCEGPQGPQLQETLERLTGQHTVPNVFIDTMKLYQDGELEPLLSEANTKRT